MHRCISSAGPTSSHYRYRSAIRYEGQRNPGGPLLPRPVATQYFNRVPDLVSSLRVCTIMRVSTRQPRRPSSPLGSVAISLSVLRDELPSVFQARPPLSSDSLSNKYHLTLLPRRPLLPTKSRSTGTPLPTTFALIRRQDVWSHGLCRQLQEDGEAGW